MMMMMMMINVMLVTNMISDEGIFNHMWGLVVASSGRRRQSDMLLVLQSDLRSSDRG